MPATIFLTVYSHSCPFLLIGSDISTTLLQISEKVQCKLRPQQTAVNSLSLTSNAPASAHTFPVRMKLCTESDRQKEMRFKLRSERMHQQVATRRRRSLYVQPIDSQKAWLFVETELITITTRHRSDGRLHRPDMTNSKCTNYGIISKYCFRDLVKPIFSADIPAIIEDFRIGIPFSEIKYSSWACSPKDDINWQTRQQQTKMLTSDSDQSLFASTHKNSTFTTRLIKSVTSLIGF